MIAEPHRDIDVIFKDSYALAKPMQMAVREALRQHKAAGNPVAVWQDGDVVWLQPSELTLNNSQDENRM